MMPGARLVTQTRSMYIWGGGPRFAVMARGLVPELPAVAALCLAFEPSSVGVKFVFRINQSIFLAREFRVYMDFDILTGSLSA